MIYSCVTIILIILLIIIFYLIFSENFENVYLDQIKIDENNEIQEKYEIPEYVFIIVRHVNSELTNKYWKESYNCIRKFYPDVKVVIIDDNSNEKYLNDLGVSLNNVEIIKSEFPGRGELLPYYYFYKNHFAKKAIIIHDSIFIQEKINFNDIDDVKFLWHHMHYFDNVKEEKEKILSLRYNYELDELYDNKKDWLLSCGVMSVIDYDFLKKIEEKYNFFNLLNVIKTRSDRMCLERVFGLVCHAIKPELVKDPSFFGIQHEYNYTFNDYLKEKNNKTLKKKIVKVFTGR
jgi:hypothetical protein